MILVTTKYQSFWWDTQCVCFGVGAKANTVSTAKSGASTSFGQWQVSTPSDIPNTRPSQVTVSCNLKTLYSSTEFKFQKICFVTKAHTYITQIYRSTGCPNRMFLNDNRPDRKEDKRALKTRM